MVVELRIGHGKRGGGVDIAGSSRVEGYGCRVWKLMPRVAGRVVR